MFIKSVSNNIIPKSPSSIIVDNSAKVMFVRASQSDNRGFIQITTNHPIISNLHAVHRRIAAGSLLLNWWKSIKKQAAFAAYFFNR